MRGAASYWVLRAAGRHGAARRGGVMQLRNRRRHRLPGKRDGVGDPDPHRPRDRGNQPVPRQLQQADHRNPAHEHHRPCPDGPRRGTDQPSLRGPDHLVRPHRRDRASARTAQEPAGAVARPGLRQPGRTGSHLRGCGRRPAYPCGWPRRKVPCRSRPWLRQQTRSASWRGTIRSCAWPGKPRPSPRSRWIPELEVAADGQTAVVRLLLQPRAAGGGGELVIDRIEETTLLAEASQAPWPRSVTVRAGGAPAQVRLGIRPSRCDPHAVAEDKVGTLLPLQVRVAGREGIVKIDAGSQLRARIYDFVTKACGRQ